MTKILLAEDDFTMVKLLTTLLKMEGHDVVALDVHEDVLSAVQQNKADALLMDVHLGDKNGMEIAKAIRAKQKNTGIKIIMTSGLNVKEECIENGADHFLLKPFMPDDLLKLLKK